MNEKLTTPLRDMTEPELTQTMRVLASAIEAILPDGTLFALLVFDDPGLAQYVSNVKRADIIGAMRECASQLEAREEIARQGDLGN